ncbi:YhbY family RNA-binding protein [Porticoccus sp. W117]|uniref:YhbY family RNA-binding protein n=1 Tax=Porticoccus sp. W117 TaxID=3054777 RepID=UPI002597D6F7|nr:YhbY family RNA-binding protein [Porticoccus sp. W117]MDM3871301.1 YhbY family RNA-binding protein [Porticoccus sp. W117]
MPLSNDEKKHLRRMGHNLNPVVTVAGNGVSEGVLAEIERALSDHELIKVKFAIGDREAKKLAMDEVCSKTGAELAQTIGHIGLFYRKAEKPNPKLSNLLR